MTENKRFTYFNTWGWNGDAFRNVMNGLDRKNNELKERVKQQEELISEQAIQLDYLQDENRHMKDVLDENRELKERIQELKNKLNQTALELLNYDMISMGKAVEISEMSYINFLKYRKKHGNSMELQL